MSASHAATVSHAPTEQPRLTNPVLPLGVGLAGIALTAIGAFTTSTPEAATRLGISWLIGMTFWTDAAILGSAGIPSVLFGPGGAGLHSAVEYVRLRDVEICRDALVALARRFVAGT